MVGGGAKDHKFAAKILDQVHAGRTTLYAVGDKLGTPTYVPDFPRRLLGLIPTESYGRYHMACEGGGSRFDIAATILAILVARRHRTRRGRLRLLRRRVPVVRPRSEIMRNLHLDLQGLNAMRPWPVALAEYLHTEFGDLIDDLGGSRIIDLEPDRPHASLQKEAAR